MMDFKKLKEYFEKVKLYAIYLLILGVVFLSYFPRSDWQLRFIVTFGGLVFGFIISALSKIQDLSISNITRPTFNNFGKCGEDIGKEISLIINASKDIDIKIIAISGKYYCIYIFHQIESLLSLLNNNKLSINIVIPSINCINMQNLQVKDWSNHQKYAISNIESIKDQFKDSISSGKLYVNLIETDTLPMIHGLIINDTILYKGSISPIFKIGENGEITDPELGAGSLEYRKYQMTPNSEDYIEIDRFLKWYSWFSKNRKEKFSVVFKHSNTEKETSKIELS